MHQLTYRISHSAFSFARISHYFFYFSFCLDESSRTAAQMSFFFSLFTRRSCDGTTISIRIGDARTSLGIRPSDHYQERTSSGKTHSPGSFVLKTAEMASVDSSASVNAERVEKLSY